MSREGIIGLAVTVTIIYIATRGFPAVSWVDGVGVTALASIGWWLVRSRARDAERPDESRALRLGKALRRIRRGAHG
jgi:hypothetical protein